MTVEQRIDEQNDKFPVGMRVLAVDDDPTCLMLLETLLRKCQYHVTTTSQAVTALKMLRENRNKFDLVISDVHMPDMDGFKLLELVGLEMDLPVIMLSAYGDTKLVMKGVTHGACDYLLKPVRIEELKNIWQHVIRRKKLDPKEHKDFDKPHDESNEVGEGLTGTGDFDQNGKLNGKRKEQNDDAERDDGGHNNEDPSTQKKPRVVWSAELHRKFVAVVSQLGIDKAVPKRILDMMNVEKLTRENVASHLQKYRLYLKRISCVASQQGLGSADSAYLRMASLNGLGNHHALGGSGQFQNAAFRSFAPGSVLGRLNTPAGLGMRNLSSSGTVQPGHAQNSGNPINGLNNFHPLIQPGNQNGNILQGMPMSLELDKLQHSQGVTHIGELSATSDSMVYPLSCGFSDTKINAGYSSNDLFGVPNNPITVEGNLLDDRRREVFRNQSSVTANSLDLEFTSHLSDFERCNDNWPNVVQTSQVQSNSYTSRDCFKRTNPSDWRDDISSMATHMVINPHDVCSVTSSPAQFPDTRTDFIQCQAAPISSNIRQNMNFTPKQRWDDHKQDEPHQSNLLCRSMNSSITHVIGGPFNANNDFNLIGQSNFVDPIPMRHNEVQQPAMEMQCNEVQLPAMETKLRLKQKPQGSYAHKNVDSLEDLVSVMMKQDQNKLII